MNVKSLFICISLIVLNLFSLKAVAESFVWKVSKAGDYFYLGGTIHMLNAEDHPLPKGFSIAYNDVTEVIFETDILAAETPEFQTKLLAIMTFSDDRTLESELKPDTYRKLEKFLVSRQIPIEKFIKFQPWGISLMITLLEYQRLGMMPNYGVDAYYNNLALADTKEINSLETPEQQLNFISSMAAMDPDVCVEYTLRDLEHLPEFIEKMKNNWRVGNLKKFSKHSSFKKMKKEFPGMYRALVLNRNSNWLEQLPSFLDDSDKELVLVGAMHLIGKEGLLNQLKKQGFKIKQLD